MSLSHNLFHQLDEREIELVINVHTYAIAATLVYKQKNQTPQVVAHTQQVFEMAQNNSEEDVFDSTVGVLKTVCENILTKAHGIYEIKDLLDDHQRIHKVSLFLPGVLLKQEYHNRERTWEQDIELSRGAVSDLFVDEIPQGYARLDRHIVNTNINGYSVVSTQLVGKKAHHLEISYVEHFARFDYIETMFQVLYSVLNIDEDQLTVRSGQIAILQDLQKNNDVPDDYGFLSSCGPYSDVMIVRGGHIVALGTISFGIQHLVSDIVENKLAPTAKQALSLLRLHNHGDLEASISSSIDELAQQRLDIKRESISYDLSATFQEPIDMTGIDTWYLYAPSATVTILEKAFQKEYTTVISQHQTTQLDITGDLLEMVDPVERSVIDFANLPQSNDFVQ